MPGEDIIDAAKRETKEELGFIPEKLSFLYSYIFSGEIKRELVYTFSSIPADKIDFNTEEIDGISFWDMETIENSLGSGIFSENLEWEIGQYLKFRKT